MRRAAVLVAVATALGAGGPVPARAQALRRDLGSYFIFAMRNADLKNITVQGPCNVGVDCAQPASNSSCGVLDEENALYADGSQIAGDIVRFNKPGANVFQIFRNGGSSLAGVTIRDPGPLPDGTNPLTPLPILGDLDGDGQPSCAATGGSCVVDAGDLEVACGFPTPFPACAPQNNVRADPGKDCSGAPDAVPGNGRCDLPPGAYGDVVVANGASLDFVGGSYALCAFDDGKNTTVTTSSATTLEVSGDVRINNGSRVGQQCGDLVVQAKGAGVVGFGRNAVIVGRFCAPQRTLSLGHDNDLTGQFVGDIVRADSNDTGHCCGGPCSCFDAFTPSIVHVGDTVRLTSACSLANVTQLTICGVPATITSKSSSVLQATVPAVPTGTCPVAVQSPAGLFTGVASLTIH
ncbi:MAG: hypothetical protein KIT14_07240 [bacterium]|nr:hypothetical protein [bacterium]